VKAQKHDAGKLTPGVVTLLVAVQTQNKKPSHHNPGEAIRHDAGKPTKYISTPIVVTPAYTINTNLGMRSDTTPVNVHRVCEGSELKSDREKPRDARCWHTDAQRRHSNSRKAENDAVFTVHEPGDRE
jgi:hypothetical protein